MCIILRSFRQFVEEVDLAWVKAEGLQGLCRSS